MPDSAVLAHLDALYAASDDPWASHTSAYEQAKFAETVAQLPRARYRLALEAGCGAGALTARLAERTDRVLALDASAAALDAARRRAAGLRGVDFRQALLPQDTPLGPFDLAVLSEVLYFLTSADIDTLAARLPKRADVVAVDWLGETGTGLSGDAAADRLLDRLDPQRRRVRTLHRAHYRIDVLPA